MPSAIAFFPWVAAEKPIEIGDVRLLPYVRGRLPGDTVHASQRDIDAILRAYAHRKNQAVQKATLLELGTWRAGQDAKRHVHKLFRARELIAFSAISTRSLFRHFDYCNFDTFALAIQQYNPGGAGTFSFFTRRRDGRTQNLWGTTEFAFQRPLHVDLEAKFKIDEALLAAMRVAEKAKRLSLEAIVEFNRANTDSSDVPSHMEIVLTKSAFEFFFQIGNKWDDFVKALNAAIPVRTPVWPTGPLTTKWRKRFPKATRPIDAWGREFCDLRGSAAHGNRRGAERFIWSESSHLAFASILFPLLVKDRLTRDGFMNRIERDAVHLELCESYLMHNPFAGRGRSTFQREHVWSKVYSNEVSGELMRRYLAKRIAQMK